MCGTVVAGKYRIASVVGRGGFGLVYRGVHAGFGEPIAVKCLDVPADLDAAGREALLGRLEEEGAILHRLSKRSPAIVQALDVGAVTAPSGRWTPYLVLEWLDGRTMAAFLRERRAAGEGGMPLGEAIALLDPVARALALAHRQGVAHRDVKPENLFLAEIDGRRVVKVLDFGIAKVLAGHASFSASPAATGVRPSAFTPRYGAPEQFNKRLGATGPWTDVFALALIVVELASGEPALEGDDPTQLYVAATDPAARPTLRRHGVEAGEAVEQVLGRALEIQPQDRFPDAGAFWQELRRATGAPAGDGDMVPADDMAETGDFAARHGIAIEAAPAGPEKLPAEACAATVDAAPPPSSDGFELDVVELAAEGVELTAANVAARLRIVPAQAEAALARMAGTGRLVPDAGAAGGAGAAPAYRVAGLSMPAPGRWQRFGPHWRRLLRWLKIDPAIAPVLEPAARKSVPIGVALGAFLPGIGLLYAAPVSMALLLTLVGIIVAGTLDDIPFVGGVLSGVFMIAFAVLSGVLGGAHAWHFNRQGKRTPLIALRRRARRGA
ncbi:MAG: serine/threonine protein kinase [Deltaproteobacteria bacterium]|nr:serine/threonine protein kinase [Deltaproteobacteria bacterium]